MQNTSYTYADVREEERERQRECMYYSVNFLDMDIFVVDVVMTWSEQDVKRSCACQPLICSIYKLEFIFVLNYV